MWTPRISERELRSRLFGSHIESSRAYFPEVFSAIVELGPGSSREGFLVLEARASDPWLEFEPDGVYVDARKDCRFVMTVRDGAYIIKSGEIEDGPAVGTVTFDERGPADMPHCAA